MLTDDLEELLVLGLHTSVVGLHFHEVVHSKTVTVGVLVAVVYMSLASIEAWHIKRDLRQRHTPYKINEPQKKK